jgi:hypothetical protein
MKEEGERSQSNPSDYRPDYSSERSGTMKSMIRQSFPMIFLSLPAIDSVTSAAQQPKVLHFHIAELSRACRCGIG